MDCEYWLVFFDRYEPKKPTVLRQLLLGRMTSSSLFWGFKYNYLKYLCLEPTIKTKDFDAQITNLISENLLLKTDEGCTLTDEGWRLSEEYRKKNYLYKKPEIFSYFKYNELELLFKLVVQVVSEYSYNNRNYYVVTDNTYIQYLVKNWIKKYGIAELTNLFSTTLIDFLSSEDKNDASVFVAMLTGHNQVGKTIQQIAKITNLSILSIERIYRDLLVRYAVYCIKQKNNLSKLFRVFYRLDLLSPSARQTYDLLLKGYSLTQITQQKNIKMSTVCDHLIFIRILCKERRLDQYVTDDIKNVLDELVVGDVSKLRYNNLSGDVQKKIPFVKFRLYQIQRIENDG